MKKLHLLGLLCVCLSGPARADEATRNAQTELKSQGFYYGETDGQLSTETSAAIKRFQIRNGLEVTGTLTKQTLEALDLVPAATSSPARPAAPPPAQPPPPVDLRRDQNVQESDRSFLRRQESAPPPQPSDPSIVSPPAPLTPPAAPGEEYAALFFRTPYATAPREVQESALRRAQTALVRGGHYREAIDGVPGPATEEALLSYQRSARLPLTGRLDLQTLAQLRLLPTRAANAPLRPFRQAPQRPAQRAYRGIWIE